MDLVAEALHFIVLFQVKQKQFMFFVCFVVVFVVVGITYVVVY